MPKPTALVRKRHEYDDVYSLRFRNPGLRHEAGRYAHVLVGKVWSGDAAREPSFASAPYEEELVFTVNLGSGTRYKSQLASEFLRRDPVGASPVREGPRRSGRRSACP